MFGKPGEQFALLRISRLVSDQRALGRVRAELVQTSLHILHRLPSLPTAALNEDRNIKIGSFLTAQIHRARIALSPQACCARALLPSNRDDLFGRSEETAVEVNMSYTQSPPLAEDEWQAQPVAPDTPLRHPDDQPARRIVTGPRAARSFGRRGLNEAVDRPSVGRKIFRSLARFLIAVSIGVGGTIAAQTDTAREMLTTQAPALASLLSVAPAKSIAVAVPVQQPSPLVSPLASDLLALRRSIEQLAVKQDQMSQNVAALQALQEDIRQKMSSTPPSQPQQASPPPKPAQVRALSPQQASAPRPAAGAPSPPPSR
jgi:hypothetical protein